MLSLLTIIVLELGYVAILLRTHASQKDKLLFALCSGSVFIENGRLNVGRVVGLQAKTNGYGNLLTEGQGHDSAYD